MQEKIVNIEFLHEDAEKRKAFFHISKRIDNKKIVIKDESFFEPYFYINAIEKDKISALPLNIKSKISIVDDNHKSLFDKNVIKISFKFISKDEFNTAKKFFDDTYEDDVLYLFRYIIDKNIKYDINQRILYIDIETNLCTDIENPDGEIISICCYDSFLKKYITFVWHKNLEEKSAITQEESIYFFNDEESFLNKFIYFMNNTSPDIITGWNIKKFDVPYIIARCKKLKIKYNAISIFNRVDFIIKSKDKNLAYNEDKVFTKIYGLSIVDAMDVYKKLTYDNKPDSYSLDTVARHTIGRGKLEHKNIKWMWDNSIDDLLKYNKNDVEILYLIDKKNHLLEYFLAVQQIIPIPAEQIFHNSRVVDMYILQEYHNKFVFPSKKKNEHIKFEGAFCGKLKSSDDLTLEKKFLKEKIVYQIYDDEIWFAEDPDAQIHKNVVVFDFASLYPSIYLTFNISPETISENGEIILDKLKFSAEKKGLIPEILEKMLLERKKLEIERDKIQDTASSEYYALNNKQGALKSINNSLYGIMGYKNFRLYNPRIPESICYGGRICLLIANDFFESKKLEVIYTDTDSCMVKLGDNLSKDECIKFSEELTTELNTILQSRLKELFNLMQKISIKIEYEKIFSSIIFFGVKKRYSGLLFYKKGKHVDELFSRGVEIVRRDTPKCIRIILKEIFIDIIKNESLETIKNKLDFAKKQLKNKTIWDIGSSKQISRELSSYKNNAQHIVAAKYSNKYLKTNFDKADYPKIVFVKVRHNNTYPKTDVICVDENTILPAEMSIDWDKIFDIHLHSKLLMFKKIPQFNNIEKIYNNMSSLEKWLEV